MSLWTRAGLSWRELGRRLFYQIYEDDVLFITWSAVSDKAQATDGVDTFVFRDDSIRVQTVRYTVESTGGA